METGALWEQLRGTIFSPKPNPQHNLREFFPQESQSDPGKGGFGDGSKAAPDRQRWEGSEGPEGAANDSFLSNSCPKFSNFH